MRAIHSKPLSDSDLNRLVSDALKTPTATAEAMLIADLFGRIALLRSLNSRFRH